MPDPSIENTREYLVVKSNALIQRSRYTMPLSLQKTFAYICSLIRPPCEANNYSWPSDLLTYSFDIRDFCRTCGRNPGAGGSAREYAKYSLKALADESIYLDMGSGKEVLCRWLDEVKIDKDGIVTITIGRYLAPYLLNLKERFTQYQLWNILTMKSAYSIRLYELLRSYINLGEVTFSVDELRKLLFIKGSSCKKCRLNNTKSCLTCEEYKSFYRQFKEFKKKVLVPAVAEITEKSDITVTMKVIIKNRNASHVQFNIKQLDSYFTHIGILIANEELDKKKRKD